MVVLFFYLFLLFVAFLICRWCRNVLALFHCFTCSTVDFLLALVIYSVRRIHFFSAAEREEGKVLVPLATYWLNLSPFFVFFILCTFIFLRSNLKEVTNYKLQIIQFPPPFRRFFFLPLFGILLGGLHWTIAVTYLVLLRVWLRLRLRLRL